jgi:transcriptional regulator with XRE-family HTH domain
MRFGRHNHRASRVTAEQVINIRLRYEEGATQRELAAQYGLSAAQIGRIVRGESWAGLPSSVDRRGLGAALTADYSQPVPGEPTAEEFAAMSARIDAALVKPK